MAPPFDWFRASLPFTRFHGQLYRSPPSLARALFDCFLLVCALEAMRLYYFYTVHEKVFVSELAPDTMAAQTLAAWPDGLVATLSRPHAFNMPARLSVNRPLPILLILPRWTSSAANVVLSFMLRSAVMLHFVSTRGLAIVVTSEADIEANRGAREWRPPLGDVDRAALAITETSVYLISVDDDGQWTTITDLLGDHRPRRQVRTTHLCRISMLVPLAMLVGCDNERDGSVSCTSQHVFRLARGMASGAHASAPARSLFVGCFLASMHVSATVLAFIEALQSAISVGLPLYLIFLFTRVRLLDLKPAMVLAMYAQTMPLVLNGLFEGPLRPIDDWLDSLAAGADRKWRTGDGVADGWEVNADDDPLSEALRWAYSGLGPGQASPALPPVLFWLLHFVLALCAARETLRARHGRLWEAAAEPPPPPLREREIAPEIAPEVAAAAAAWAHRRAEARAILRAEAAATEAAATATATATATTATTAAAVATTTAAVTAAAQIEAQMTLAEAAAAAAETASAEAASAEAAAQAAAQAAYAAAETGTGVSAEPAASVVLSMTSAYDRMLERLEEARRLERLEETQRYLQEREVAMRTATPPLTPPPDFIPAPSAAPPPTPNVPLTAPLGHLSTPWIARVHLRPGDGATVTITSPQPRSVVQVNAGQYWQFVEAPWHVRFGQPWQQRCWQMQHQAMRLAWAQAAALQQAHAQAFSHLVLDARQGDVDHR